MSIFILWFTLHQPLGDMTAVIPVAAATMTPLPLLAALIGLKVRDFFVKKDMIPIDENIDTSDNGTSSIIKTKMINDEMAESDSTQKLVNGDPNENMIA